jgi:hypothetical protein
MKDPTNPMAAPTIAVKYQASGRNKAAATPASVEMTRMCGTAPGSAGSAPMNQTNKVIARQADVAATPARVHRRLSLLKSDVLTPDPSCLPPILVAQLLRHKIAPGANELDEGACAVPAVSVRVRVR